MHRRDIILKVVADSPGQDIFEDIVASPARDAWRFICAGDIVCARIAVDAVQMVGINVGISLVIVARVLQVQCTLLYPSPAHLF